MNPIRDTGTTRRLPSTLIERWHSPDGTPMTLRPVQVRDAPALKGMIESLSFRDRRRRFHGAVNGVSPAQLLNMVRVDQRRHLALVVTAQVPRGETVIADARYVVNDRGDCAEFAIVVAEGWQRSGIGKRLIAAQQRAAARNALQWLHGSVLAESAPMLALMHACGFTCTPSRHDENLVAVEIQVQTRVATHGSSRDVDGGCRTMPQRLQRIASRLPHFARVRRAHDKCRCASLVVR